MADDLATTIATQPEGNGVRVGTVLSTGPLRISLQGGIVEKPGVLASYTPSAGHLVALVRQGSTWLVLGRIISGA